MATKVVVIGAGGREHALVRALTRGVKWGDPREVVCIPGSAGIALEARCVPSVSDVDSLAKATIAEQPALVVVGPEAPLAAGLADRLRAAGIPVFGPSEKAAQIEASKAFAKEIMQAAGVPTARVRVFDDRESARTYAATAGACVVKLDGLAAGKGVIVCDDSTQAFFAVDELWRAGARLLIEERLSGPELSVIALCDGTDAIALPAARDHKRIFDGDQGPNTGGMGALCSPRDATPELIEQVMREVIAPTLAELKRRGTPFIGALYAGMMLTPEGPRVLEFNCRLGDPEAQAILIRLAADPLALLSACAVGQLKAQGFLSTRRPAFDRRTSVALVLAAANYPSAPRPGDKIEGLDSLAPWVPGGQGEDLWILHAGTRLENEAFVTAGGRVLTVVALAEDTKAARARAYAAAARLRWTGMQLRQDIGLADVQA
ncbi:MAG: phosphoribosylamine--glycine ligase [Deltaproteobacteria bacterium]|nr:phosphoribosylamine--glycine ligase [Deltaproteobacteria bacterium]